MLRLQITLEAIKVGNLGRSNTFLTHSCPQWCPKLTFQRHHWLKAQPCKSWTLKRASKRCKESKYFKDITHCSTKTIRPLAEQPTFRARCSLPRNVSWSGIRMRPSLNNSFIRKWFNLRRKNKRAKGNKIKRRRKKIARRMKRSDLSQKGTNINECKQSIFVCIFYLFSSLLALSLLHLSLGSLADQQVNGLVGVGRIVDSSS